MRRLFLSAVLTTAVVGCGGGGGGSAVPAASTAPSAGAISSAPASAAGSAPLASAAGSATAIHVRDFTLEPRDVTISSATSAVAVTNDGPTVHNVTIRDASGGVVAATADLKTGQAETIVIRIPAGSYTLFCSLPGHESLGIKGTLLVR